MKLEKQKIPTSYLIKNLLMYLFETGARRLPQGLILKLLLPYAVAIACYEIWVNTIAVLDPFALTATFTMAMLAVLFITVGATPKTKSIGMPWYDVILVLVSFAVGFYLYLNLGRYIPRIPGFDPLTQFDVLVGILIFILVLEATRRTVGLGLCLIVLIFVAYTLWGHLLSGILYHRPIIFMRFLDMVVFTTNGIFGVPVRVAATYAFLFVMFGTFLQVSGGGDFYFNLAKAISGRHTGGPAKIGVTSSALYGTLSGSPTSDVVTTGSITIPMMIRLGYPRVFAAAVEVASSTGGSILPPVMGAAAFLLVEITGIPYTKVALAAVIPAVLNFTACYLQVHFRAERLGLVGLPANQIPSIKWVFKEGGQFLAPLVVITVALIMGYTPTLVAMIGTTSVVIISFLKRDTAMWPSKLYHALSTATMRMVPVAAACAAAGMIIGIIGLTGLAGKITRLIFTVTGEHLFFSLLLAMVVCIILGMGMPTPSAYVMAAVLVTPALTALGVDLLAAHLFILYFAVMSAITPPVAVAAYAASSIAEANPFEIALQAVRLSIVIFLIPFLFIYDTHLLFQGDIIFILYSFLTAVIGVYALAAGVEGWLLSSLGFFSRIALIVSGIIMMYPGWLSDLLGITTLFVVYILSYMRHKNITLLSRHSLFRRKTG